jgi:predicted N-acyltransferase
VARGYLPSPTYSAHWIRDAGFRNAVARFVDDEREYVRQDIEYTQEHSPFNSTVDLEKFRATTQVKIGEG